MRKPSLTRQLISLILVLLACLTYVVVNCPSPSRRARKVAAAETDGGEDALVEYWRQRAETAEKSVASLKVSVYLPLRESLHGRPS
mmetsp:Transcript_17175/g.39604  ORF Transcript_17175/g.39604 Transcript_17175/m.39604 type:complete len:86 (+) Transcript_17175:145-402(+)